MYIDPIQFLQSLSLGTLLACVFYLLRSGIDRQKGALVEAAAVTLPILVSAAFLTSRYPSLNFGNTLSIVIQVVFLTLPVFVVARLVERLRSGEHLQIADIFRITTTASLLFFVTTNLDVSENIFLVFILVGPFLAADWARQTLKPSFNLAMVFTLSFLVLAIAFAVQNVWVAYRLRYRGFVMNVSAADATEVALQLIAFLLPLIFIPAVIESFVLRTGWFTKLANRISRAQFAMGSASDLIFKRPVFEQWHFDPNVTYLNHGSFGAVPNALRIDQQRIRNRCENEPMNFLTRELESKWFDARFQLAIWLGTTPENIAFCENATAGMNEVAHWFPLSQDDEVLMNDHEYGAVRRIWQRRCDSAGAKLVNVTLPMPLSNPKQITDAILAGCNERTRLVILSHITSPTAIILPVADICAQLRARGIASCIDGPHALLQEQFRLYNLQCDFYTASCHKWLCAPLGSGFVYIDPRWQSQFQPARLSWGRLKPALPQVWSDELLWTGSRDSSAYLTIPHAIKFFSKLNRDKLDARNYELACYARRRLSEIPGAEPVTPEGREWFGWMVGVWLPSDYPHYDTLQQRLWKHHRIEVPIVNFGGRYLVRASCPLYVNTHDIDKLLRCLLKELQVRAT